MRIAGFQKINVFVFSKHTPEKNPNILLGRSALQLFMNPLKKEIK